MNLANRLKQHTKKTITKEEIVQLTGLKTDEELYSLIMENDRLLEPVRSSGTNGNRRYPVYLKYKIILQDEEPEGVLDRIRALHPKLQANGWLAGHPLVFSQHAFAIERLSSFFFEKGNVGEPVSRKERSFALFEEEKLLEKSEIKALIRHLGIQKEDLLYYDTPEYCFNDYIPDRREELTLLVCENKDIWFNIRRLMFEEERFCFFGVRMDGVVYGNGNKVSEKNSLTEYISFMKAQTVHFLYWGDIDRAGFDIFLRTKASNPALDIALFLPGYREMLRLSEGRTLPDSEDKRTLHANCQEVYSLFDGTHANRLKQVIETNKRLPQEIISYAILKQNSEETDAR